MRVFMTGATGYVGTSLTKVLLGRGWEVTALVRDPTSPASRAIGEMGALLVTGDILDPDSMRPTMTGADVVFHNAGWYEFGLGDRAGQRMQAVNVDGTANVLGLAHRLNIPRIVYTSSVAALGPTGDQVADETHRRIAPPGSHYEATKTAAHEVARRLQRLGAPIIILCPGNVIGAGDHSIWGAMVRRFVRGGMPPFSWGPEIRYSCLHIDDATEAMALAVEKGRAGESYVLTGQALSFREIMQIWDDTHGDVKERIWLNKGAAMALGTLAGPFLRLVGSALPINREAVRMAHRNWAFTAAKARRELGATFRPPTRMWREVLAAESELLDR